MTIISPVWSPTQARGKIVHAIPLGSTLGGPSPTGEGRALSRGGHWPRDRAPPARKARVSALPGYDRSAGAKTLRPSKTLRMDIGAGAKPNQAASCFRDGWIRTSAGMPSVSCSRRIIAMERLRLRESTSASYILASRDKTLVGVCSPVASWPGHAGLRSSRFWLAIFIVGLSSE